MASLYKMSRLDLGQVRNAKLREKLTGETVIEPLFDMVKETQYHNFAERMGGYDIKSMKNGGRAEIPDCE